MDIPLHKRELDESFSFLKNLFESSFPVDYIMNFLQLDDLIGILQGCRMLKAAVSRFFSAMKYVAYPMRQQIYSKGCVAPAWFAIFRRLACPETIILPDMVPLDHILQVVNRYTSISLISMRDPVEESKCDRDMFFGAFQSVKGLAVVIRCHYCRFHSTSVEEADAHKTNYHPNSGNLFKCFTCFYIDTWRGMEQHTRSYGHDLYRPVECKTCKMVVQVSELEKHRGSHGCPGTKVICIASSSRDHGVKYERYGEKDHSTTKQPEPSLVNNFTLMFGATATRSLGSRNSEMISFPTSLDTSLGGLSGLDQSLNPFHAFIPQTDNSAAFDFSTRDPSPSGFLNVGDLSMGDLPNFNFGGASGGGSGGNDLGLLDVDMSSSGELGEYFADKDSGNGIGDGIGQLSGNGIGDGIVDWDGSGTGADDFLL